MELSFKRMGALLAPVQVKTLCAPGCGMLGSSL